MVGINRYHESSGENDLVVTIFHLYCWCLINTGNTLVTNTFPGLWAGLRWSDYTDCCQRFWWFIYGQCVPWANFRMELLWKVGDGSRYGITFESFFSAKCFNSCLPAVSYHHLLCRWTRLSGVCRLENTSTTLPIQSFLRWEEFEHR